MSRMWGQATAIALAIGLLLAGSARGDTNVAFQPAGDPQVQVTGSDAGERISLSHRRASPDVVRISPQGLGDPAVSTSTPAVCRNDFGTISCSGNIIGSYNILMLGGADDVKFVEGDARTCFPGDFDSAVTIGLGDGDDHMSVDSESTDCQPGTYPDGLFRPVFMIADGGRGADVLDGGQGNDTLSGFDGTDTLSGNGGNDTLNGQLGGDELFGGPANDTLNGGPGGDHLVGNAGFDTISEYSTSQVPVVVTTGDGLPNDGRRTNGISEGDNVSATVEKIVGGAADDQLTGSSGNDTLIGGLGADTLAGGAGNDTLAIRDGAVDAPVDCGPGDDSVTSDLVDLSVVFGRTFYKDCEHVDRFALDDGPPGHATSKRIRIGTGGRASVRISCPRAARVACHGTLSLREFVGKERLAAKAGYRVARGKSAGVGLGVPAGEAARLRRERHAFADTSEKGVSRKGPRSALVELAVR